MEGFINFTYDNRQEMAVVVSEEKLKGEIIPNTFGLSEPVHKVHEFKNYTLYAGQTNSGNILWYATKVA